MSTFLRARDRDVQCKRTTAPTITLLKAEAPLNARYRRGDGVRLRRSSPRQVCARSADRVRFARGRLTASGLRAVG